MSGAAIALHQGGSALEAGADDNFVVNPSAELTISAEADESLMDGELKQATLTIVDAEAYDVGDTGMVTVTVNGDSDVPGPEPVPTPALPLIAQWLLGLGLMGGGARQLFRRRRQG